MNILLVDDEPLELEQLEFLIKPLFPAWIFFHAPNGAQALKIAEQNTIDVAFLDIQLPGISGLELGRLLKLKQKKIDIIIVTAYQDFAYTKQSIRLGAIDYITKPISESELNYVLGKYSSPGKITPCSAMVTKAKEFIHASYSQKLKLNDLAFHAHANPSYLSRRFHEEVGIAFSDYLTHVRIENSKELLLQYPDWSIALIAEKVGFVHQQYFSTMFRRITGETPIKYRERLK